MDFALDMAPRGSSPTIYLPHQGNFNRDKRSRDQGYRLTPKGWPLCVGMSESNSTAASADKASAMTDTTSAMVTSPQKFGGICWDEGIGKWTMCYQIEQDGGIFDEDKYYRKACEPHISKPAINETHALKIIGDSSQAVACLHLINCVYSKMSGFFLEKEYFLTCAHFEPLGDTEKKMQEPDSRFARASVNREPLPLNTGGLWLHLVHYDKDRDLALFRINETQDEEAIYPKFTVGLDRLVPAKDLDFMTKFKDRRVFTMGYNQYGHDDANVYQRYFEGMHKQLSPTTASQLRVHMRGFEKPPTFEAVFLPGKKTLSVGILTEENLDGVQYNHRVSGWYGISGALIACMDHDEKIGKPIMVIIGVCGIEDSTDNTMIPFTQEDIDTISAKISGSD